VQDKLVKLVNTAILGKGKKEGEETGWKKDLTGICHCVIIKST
jgi:hypothetical protein